MAKKKTKKKEVKEKSKRKVLKGKVVSSKMQKTVVVEVERKQAHKLYKKIYTDSKRYKAHTEEELEVGDMVDIEQCSPISKDKTWIVRKVY